MAILNLTQHPATAEQIAAGVIDLPEAARQKLSNLLTFADLPEPQEIADRAHDIALLAASMASPDDRDDRSGSFGFATDALIGGAPFLMAPLERALADQGFTPLYAFSRRESVEERQPDGSVRKVNVFRHAGFVRARFEE
jgi:hypothetical protein